jgi:hypothetical protein
MGSPIFVLYLLTVHTEAWRSYDLGTHQVRSTPPSYHPLKPTVWMEDLFQDSILFPIYLSINVLPWSIRVIRNIVILIGCSCAHVTSRNTFEELARLLACIHLRETERRPCHDGNLSETAGDRNVTHCSARSRRRRSTSGDCNSISRN